MKYKEFNKIRVDKFINSLKRDIKSLEFQEETKEGKQFVIMKIGNFFFRKEVDDSYEESVKKLFEDFMTNTSYYYIRNFWGL